MAKDLLILVFDDEQYAGEVLDTLRASKDAGEVDFEDAVAVVHTADEKLRLLQGIDPTASTTIVGSLIGLVIGFLFSIQIVGLGALVTPLAAALAGAGVGALSGKWWDYGLDDDFLRQLGETMKPGTSGVFLLVSRPADEATLAKMHTFGGTLLQTSLSGKLLDRLQDMLASTDVSDEDRQPRDGQSS
jgi:uncharacterized membrane protein